MKTLILGALLLFAVVAAWNINKTSQKNSHEESAATQEYADFAIQPTFRVK